MGIEIGHEAHRDGLTGTKDEQFVETVNAVVGHTAMAMRMQNDPAYKEMMDNLIVNDGNLVNDMLALKSGDMQTLLEHVDGNYDSSADYWNYVEETVVSEEWDGEGNLVEKSKVVGKWEWDGSFDFTKDGETIPAEAMERMSKDPNNANYFDSDFAYHELRSQSTPFANASIAGKALMGDMSQGNIDLLNTALSAVQDSGLLIGNDSVIDISKLKPLGDGLYVPVELGKGQAVHKITDLYNYRIIEMARGITKHWGIDLGGVADSNVVSAADGSMELKYDDIYGVNATNRFETNGKSTTIRLSHLENEKTVMAYLANFGTKGVSLNGSILNGIKAGTNQGEVGATGSSTAQHLHFEIWENDSVNPIDPMKSALFGTYFSKTAETDPWQTRNSGYQKEDYSSFFKEYKERNSGGDMSLLWEYNLYHGLQAGWSN